MGFSGSMPMRCAWWPGDNGGDGAVFVAAPHVGTVRKYLAASSSSARTSARSSGGVRYYDGSPVGPSLNGSPRRSLEGNPWS